MIIDSFLPVKSRLPFITKFLDIIYFLAPCKINRHTEPTAEKSLYRPGQALRNPGG